MNKKTTGALIIVVALLVVLIGAKSGLFSSGSGNKASVLSGTGDQVALYIRSLDTTIYADAEAWQTEISELKNTLDEYEVSLDDKVSQNMPAWTGLMADDKAKEALVETLNNGHIPQLVNQDIQYSTEKLSADEEIAKLEDENKNEDGSLNISGEQADRYELLKKRSKTLEVLSSLTQVHVLVKQQLVRNLNNNEDIEKVVQSFVDDGYMEIMSVWYQKELIKLYPEVKTIPQEATPEEATPSNENPESLE